MSTDVPQFLQDLSSSECSFFSQEFANQADSNEKYPSQRNQFEFPTVQEGARYNAPGEQCVYLCGNSLGLLPKGVRSTVNAELDKWADQGVEGHFTEPRPWVTGIHMILHLADVFLCNL